MHKSLQLYNKLKEFITDKNTALPFSSMKRLQPGYSIQTEQLNNNKEKTKGPSKWKLQYLTKFTTRI